MESKEKALFVAKINLHMSDILRPLTIETKDTRTWKEQILAFKGKSYFKTKRNQDYWRAISFFENGEFDDLCAAIGYDNGHIEKTIAYIQRGLTLKKQHGI